MHLSTIKGNKITRMYECTKLKAEEFIQLVKMTYYIGRFPFIRLSLLLLIGLHNSYNLTVVLYLRDLARVLQI